MGLFVFHGMKNKKKNEFPRVCYPKSSRWSKRNRCILLLQGELIKIGAIQAGMEYNWVRWAWVRERVELSTQNGCWMEYFWISRRPRRSEYPSSQMAVRVQKWNDAFKEGVTSVPLLWFHQALGFLYGLKEIKNNSPWKKGSYSLRFLPPPWGPLGVRPQHKLKRESCSTSFVEANYPLVVSSLRMRWGWPNCFFFFFSLCEHHCCDCHSAFIAGCMFLVSGECPHLGFERYFSMMVFCCKFKTLLRRVFP